MLAFTASQFSSMYPINAHHKYVCTISTIASWQLTTMFVCLSCMPVVVLYALLYWYSMMAAVITMLTLGAMNGMFRVMHGTVQFKLDISAATIYCDVI